MGWLEKQKLPRNQKVLTLIVPLSLNVPQMTHFEKLSLCSGGNLEETPVVTFFKIKKPLIKKIVYFNGSRDKHSKNNNDN